MKILILGHGQHGKDTAAELLQVDYDFAFASSSWFVFEHVVWPALVSEYHKPFVSLDQAKSQCYADRRVRREEWRKLIREYNTPDLSRLTRELLEDNDIYVGLRDRDEYNATRKLFDLVFWIHRIGYPYDDPSMQIEFDLSMIPIINIGDSSTMLTQMRKHVDALLV